MSGSPIRNGRSRTLDGGHGGKTNLGAGGSNSTLNINLWKLLLLELNIEREQKTVKEGLDEGFEKRHDTSMDQLLNGVKIPLYLEKFMMFGLLYCLNAFLTLLIIVPLRITMNLMLFFRRSFVSERLQYIRLNWRILKRDLIYVFTVLTTLMILKSLDTSKIYHNIKNGTAIKLYVMMGILEVADKLFSSLGQDLLDILFNISIKPNVRSCLKFVTIVTLNIGYLVCHSYVFIYQIMSLTVAINSYSNALLTLILSAQFSELKSSVFKKFEREGLFQITCADLTERFQLFTILFIISLKNLNIENNNTSLKPNSWYMNSSNYINIWFGIIMGPTFVVIGSEVMVDWLKHLYITKFNKIKPSIYDKYSRVLSSDYMDTYRNFTSTSEETTHDNNLDGILLVKRIGLPLLTMIIVFVKMSIIPLFTAIISEFKFVGALLILSVFITVLFVRLVLSLILLKWSNLILLNSSKKNRSLIHDFVDGSPSTSLVELNNALRKHLYDWNEKIPPSLEEARNVSILKLVNKKRKLMGALDKRDGNDDTDNDNDQLDNLNDVRRYEMASKRIW